MRRGGLTTARYREVMITPVGPGLDEEQHAFLERALLGVGSTLVPRFPRLVSRLGAPATGASDIPERTDLDPAGSFKKFLGQLLGLRLRGIVEADLAVRGGDLGAVERVLEEVRRLALELTGLALVVDAEWRSDLLDELDWLLGDGEDRPERLPARLRSERYLALLDALVTAARAPRLGETSTQPAVEVLRALLTAARGAAGAAVRAAEEADPAPAWPAVASALTQLEAAAELAGHLLPEAADAVRTRLAEPRRLLAALLDPPLTEEDALASLAGSSPEQAFVAGRAFEQQAARATRARARFVRAWAKAEHKLARQQEDG